jgi:hypothetical protein
MACAAVKTGGENGKCLPAKAGVGCGSAMTCSNGVLTSSGSCNGAGACVNGTQTAPCPGNFTCASANACATTCTALSTTGCKDGYECGTSGSACTLATVPCGLDGATSCPIANKGGCNYTDAINLCDANWGGTSSDPSFVPCDSKAECPSGTFCCLQGNNSCSNGGWDVRCDANVSRCNPGTYTFGYYLCDPALASADCPSGMGCKDLSTSCFPGLHACAQ